MLFTDANYWIAEFCEKDEWHQRAKELRRELVYENLLLSEHIFAEVFTFIARRYGKDLAYTSCRALLVTPRVEIVDATEEHLQKAIEIGRKFGFSFADSITIAHMEEHSVKKIVSFDSDFDKIRAIERVH